MTSSLLISLLYLLRLIAEVTSPTAQQLKISLPGGCMSVGKVKLNFTLEEATKA
jgi:hypothetical protein